MIPYNKQTLDENNIDSLVKVFEDKIIIGTAQFGLKYGINNLKKIETEQITKIMEFCLKNNIRVFDTAEDYGDSEFILSSYQDNINIITKSKNLSAIQAHSQKYFKHIDCYMIHDFKLYNKDLISNYKKILTNVKSIGISIYEKDELIQLLKDDVVEIIQIPFNLLRGNTYWFTEDCIQLLRKSRCKIYARSIFLQGLLLSDLNTPSNLDYKNISEIHNHLNKICKEYNITKLQLCIGYVNNCKYIDKFLVGIDNLKQLEEITYSNLNLNKDIIDKLESIKIYDDNIIDPRKWN